MQPTNKELKSTLNLVKTLLITHSEFTSTAITALRSLRSQRTYWFGTKENKLRCDIDRILRSKL